jgi:SAM-dependent methyltransferase
VPSPFTVLAKRVFSDFDTRLRLRRIAGWPLDVVDVLTGRRDPLIPPRGLWFIGDGSRYPQVVESSFGCLLEAGLTPHDRVLDIGCGVGSMAVRLTRFMDGGSYDGFDVIRAAIDWASSHISPRYPNFRFQHAQVFSRHYNPRGTVQPQNYIFPYPAAGFDFVFGLSLFTHLLPAAAGQYLREMARVMTPQATAWITVFLINDESIACLRRARSMYRMQPHGDCWVMDPAFPETAVGLPESDFLRWCDSAGLKIKRIDRGSWCGREQYRFGHDHVILTK